MKSELDYRIEEDAKANNNNQVNSGSTERERWNRIIKYDNEIE